MLRKKVLSVGPTNATLLVEETATGSLKVLHRINMTSWRQQDVDTAQQVCRVLSQNPIPVMVDVENVVLQNTFLNVVVPYFPLGDLASHVRASPTHPPSDAQIAKWIHVAALATQTLHRRGFVHAALRLDKLYMSEDRGAAGVVVGIPQPLPLYFEALAEAKKRVANSSSAVVGGGGSGSSGATAAPRSNLSVTNMSVNSLELNFPPEVLSFDDGGLCTGSAQYDARSDVWHLGAMMMALAAAHQQLPNRTAAIQMLVNEMCHDDPAQRPTTDQLLVRLQALHDVQGQHPSRPGVGLRSVASNDSILEVRDDVCADIPPPLRDPPAHHAQSNVSPSPEPVDPRPAAARRRTPPLVVPVVAAAEDVRAAQGGSSPVGMVLTPRGHGHQHAAHPRKSATPTSTKTGGARVGRSTQPTHYQQPQRRQGTPSGSTATLRAHSRPLGYAAMSSSAAVPNPTAARAVHLASAAYLTQALEAEQAEAQRRRDEAAREVARRRDQTEKERQAADEVHRQHQGNLRRIRQIHPQHHRDDIRRSIRQWQQQQQPLQEGDAKKQHANVVSVHDGIAIFATSDVPPPDPNVARGQVGSRGGRVAAAAAGHLEEDTYDTDSLTSPVSPPHRQQTAGVPSDSNDAGSSNEERDERGGREQHASSATPKHARRRDVVVDDASAPVVFEITPPRRRKPHPHGGKPHGESGGVTTAAAVGGPRAPFSHVSRHGDVVADAPQRQQHDIHHRDPQHMPGTVDLSGKRRVNQASTDVEAAVPSSQRRSSVPSLNVLGSTSPLSIDEVSRSAEGTVTAAGGEDIFGVNSSRHVSIDSTAAPSHVQMQQHVHATQHTETRSSHTAATAYRTEEQPRPTHTGGMVEEGIDQTTAASIDVAAVAAMEWSGETLRHTILTGPWSRDPSSSKCVVAVLRCVDAFVALPSVTRLQPKANAQLFESLRRAVVGLDDEDEAEDDPLEGDGNRSGHHTAAAEQRSRRVGLFAVLAPLAIQLAAVEGITALASELRTPSS